MSNLYNLTADYDHLLNMLYDDNMDEKTIMDTLEAIEGAIEDKADGYAMVIKSIEADITGIDGEIKRLQTRKQTLDNRIKWLKGNLEQSMRTLGKTKFKTALFSYRIQRNGGKRALVLDCDLTALPSELLKVTTTADNDAIRRMLEQEGVEANKYAHLAPQTESLRIG